MITRLTAKVTLAIAATALALSAATPAQAAVFFGLFNTGVDGSGNVLGSNQIDLHYRITATSNGNLAIPSGGADAYTVGLNTPWHPNDMVGTPGSGWITPFVNADGSPAPSTSFDPDLPGPAFTYEYTINFDIGGINPADAFLSGQVQSDNSVRVLLNGTDIGGQLTQVNSSFFQEFTAFGAGSGFNPGVNNSLKFVVTDFGVVTGLRVANINSGAVPEPGVWAMMILGFGLVAGQIRRRRRAGVAAIA